MNVEPEPQHRITKKSPLLQNRAAVAGTGEFDENPEAEIPVPLVVENPVAEIPVPLVVENPEAEIPVPPVVENPEAEIPEAQEVTEEVVVDGWGMYEMDGLLLSEDEPGGIQPVPRGNAQCKSAPSYHSRS